MMKDSVNNQNLKLLFAVNLLWVRPGKVGGTEFMIRNLLTGMQKLPDDFHTVLVVSKDNCDTFEHYQKGDTRFSLLVADTDSENIGKRIIWQNLNFNRLLRKNKLKYCFSPVYDRPVFNGGVTYVTTIHDIQAHYYPQTHPLYEVLYSKLLWHANRINSAFTVCISQFVLNDLEKTYHFKKDRMQVIYNPVSVSQLSKERDGVIFAKLVERYKISDQEYFYTVGQMIPHKNMETLLKIMAKIRNENRNLPQRLLISGISGNATDQIIDLTNKLNLENMVTLTGFISNEERDCLYKHAKAFLFPSVFEGFGIPPIEAMMCDTPVITTRCTSIPEVTQGFANYVSDPYNPDEWIQIMENITNRSNELDANRYQDKVIAEQYINTLRKAFKNTGK